MIPSLIDTVASHPNLALALGVLAVTLASLFGARVAIYQLDRLTWQVRLAVRRHRKNKPPADVEPPRFRWPLRDKRGP